MSQKVYTILYLDEQIGGPGPNAEHIRDKLISSGQLICDLKQPPQTFTELPEIPDAVLIDLDLPQASPDGTRVDYYGNALAAHIRMTNEHCPVMLVTNHSVISSRSNQRALEESQDFDLIVYKDDILNDPEPQIGHIVSLIEGFQLLSSETGQGWPTLLQLMGATEDEDALLTQASPPLERTDKQYYVPAIAHWFMRVILGYPGILYDELHAATRLGISLEAFRSPAVQELVADARYTGVFSTYRESWWRDRLSFIAQELMLEQGLSGYVPYKFAQAFALKYEEGLNPAKCVFDGSTIADWVCFVLNKPVKQEHSVIYYPDFRPSVMDKARISFKAIMEESFNENLVDPNKRELVTKIMEAQPA